eukprot:gene6474-10480_t
MFFLTDKEKQNYVPLENISDVPVVLEIGLIECKGIRERWSINGEPHTHVHFEVGEQKQSSKVITKKNNPKFFQIFKFKVTQDSEIKISVRDGLLVGHKRLGYVNLKISELKKIQTDDLWFDLKPGKLNPGVKGKIHLQFRLEPKPVEGIIKKVVVLCMENRSFDHFFGYMKGVNGVEGKEEELAVDGVKPCPKAQYIQLIDLGHEVEHAQKQLKGEWISDAYSVAYKQLISKKWPLKNLYLPPEKFVKIESETCMHCFKPEQIPIISTLAKEFCVFESWHASLAGPTHPNRWFMHCGTSDGVLTNFEVNKSKIIFDLFKDDEWKIYYHDVSGTAILNLNMLKKLKDKKTENIEPFHNFYKSAKDGTLPKYTFLEPCYFTSGKDVAQDQHPPHDIRPGEQLILDIYTALLSNEKQFEETLFLIVYDEHGGFWDHVQPPKVPKMNDKVKHLNSGVFSTLGFRVPAIAINPHIKKGTIDQRLFDHCSIPATLTKLFDLPECLSERVFHANTFDDVLNLTKPRKLKEMPDPFKLQEKLNEIYKIEYKNENIPKETIKILLENPRGWIIASKSFACLKWVYEKRLGKKNTLNSLLLQQFEDDFENSCESDQGKMIKALQKKFMENTNDEVIENANTPIPWNEPEIEFEQEKIELINTIEK